MVETGLVIRIKRTVFLVRVFTLFFFILLTCSFHFWCNVYSSSFLSRLPRVFTIFPLLSSSITKVVLLLSTSSAMLYVMIFCKITLIRKFWFSWVVGVNNISVPILENLHFLKQLCEWYGKGYFHKPWPLRSGPYNDMSYHFFNYSLYAFNRHVSVLCEQIINL